MRTSPAASTEIARSSSVLIRSLSKAFANLFYRACGITRVQCEISEVQQQHPTSLSLLPDRDNMATPHRDKASSVGSLQKTS